MRLLIASLAALTAVALATPSFARDSQPSPTPAANPKSGTKAHCNTLKGAARDACLKKLHASAPTKAKAKAKTKPKAKAKNKAAKKPAGTAQATSPSAPTAPQTIAVPPLPAKTI
jgi:hypothetical protein